VIDHPGNPEHAFIAVDQCDRAGPALGQLDGDGLPDAVARTGDDGASSVDLHLDWSLESQAEPLPVVLVLVSAPCLSHPARASDRAVHDWIGYAPGPMRMPPP